MKWDQTRVFKKLTKSYWVRIKYQLYHVIKNLSNNDHWIFFWISKNNSIELIDSPWNENHLAINQKKVTTAAKKSSQRISKIH